MEPAAKRQKSETFRTENTEEPNNLATCEAEPNKSSPGTVQVLEGCVAALDQSVKHAFSKLSQSLANNVSIMHQMNSMMEEYVLRSIVISLSPSTVRKSNCSTDSNKEKENEPNRATDHGGESIIHPAKHTLLVARCVLTVRNTCRLPLQNLSIQLDLLTAPKPTKKDSQKKMLETQQSMESGDEKTWTLECPLANESVHDIVEFIAKVEFPSPGTGETLRREERVELGLHQRLEMKALDSYSPDKSEGKRRARTGTCSVQRLRDILRLDPLLGLQLPNTFEVKWPSGQDTGVLLCAALQQQDKQVQQVEFRLERKEISSIDHPDSTEAIIHKLESEMTRK